MRQIESWHLIHYRKGSNEGAYNSYALFIIPEAVAVSVDRAVCRCKVSIGGASLGHPDIQTSATSTSPKSVKASGSSTGSPLTFADIQETRWRHV
jgi:hypothetical protein